VASRLSLFRTYYLAGRTHPMMGPMSRVKALVFAWRMTRWMVRYG
jgi:hypothetical protein